MEVDEKPTEDYNDVSGLEKQIQELVEAIVLPMTHKERFRKLGVRPPKGVLLYGPPGTGKTLMARACAAQTNATFLKLAGPQLVQIRKPCRGKNHCLRNEFASMCVIAAVGGPSPEVNTVAPNSVHPKPEWTAGGIALLIGKHSERTHRENFRKHFAETTR
ncbi:hypothetical protein F3Y22_tig00112285pilonHSYRG00595 [Hibiscus syriacus]|uniref:ATPase AAA-type core domain-containing protein n=1 Tax=Hibiscus syriacus TaxID=106335 RepID=A0A6A2Y0Z4_HIBSY|nr:hypothetical protein F3Y22_tig00112285pilonHSYRG00595 [Hibiscus syriacus]